MGRSSDIRQKEVINIYDGSKMGTIIDMEFNSDGKIASITVPGELRILDIIKGQRSGITIPWDNVVKIGLDVILVELKQNISGNNRDSKWE